MVAPYDAIVIGAGHNGLTAASYLARAGRKVLVLESRTVIGGLAAAEEFHPGYQTSGLHHDTRGMNRKVIKDLKLIEHGLEVCTDSPPIFSPQKAKDGRGFLLYAQKPEFSSNQDQERYAQYQGFFSRIKKFVGRLFQSPPPHILRNRPGDLLNLAKTGLGLRMLGKKDMLELLRIAPMALGDFLDEWFEGELLKASLAASALVGTYYGPRSPGSATNLILSECLSQTPIKGGASALTKALERCAKSQGVEIRTKSKVKRINTANGVNGVTLENGQEIKTKIVVASCTPQVTFLHLLPAPSISHKLEKQICQFRARGTTAKVHLALSKPLRFDCRPELEIEYARTGQHLDQFEKAFDAVKYRSFSEWPVLDIYIPTVSNPALAVKGHSVVSIMVHFVAYDLKEGWNNQKRDKLWQRVQTVLESYCPKIRENIIAHEILSPKDLEKRFNLTGGHIHHGEHSLDQLFMRPTADCAHYQTPISGLYLCGSGSHPGGGITCTPGSLAAQTILSKT